MSEQPKGGQLSSASKLLTSPADGKVACLCMCAVQHLINLIMFVHCALHVQL